MIIALGVSDRERRIPVRRAGNVTDPALESLDDRSA